MRPTLRVLVAGLTAGALTLAACGGGDDDDGDVGAAGEPGTSVTTAAQAPSSSTATPGAPPTLEIAETGLGPTLVDGAGLTLYVFDNDMGGTSTCAGACATAWPPLTVDGEPVAGDGIDAEDVATVTRADGTTQVTFYGMPVYRWSGDAAPGETSGLGINGVWWPIGPDGEKLTGNEQAGTSGGLDY